MCVCVYVFNETEYATYAIKTRLHILERAAAGIGLHVNVHKWNLSKSNRKHFYTKR